MRGLSVLGLHACALPILPARPSLSPFVRAAGGKGKAPEPLAVQVIEHVRLVLRVVDGGVKLGATGTLHDPRVVAGGQPVESELEHAREHEGQAHERIASYAGIRGAALEVGAVERLDDSFPELALQGPAVIRNFEDRGD